MMICPRCRKKLEHLGARCPHCGAPGPGQSGMLQTSTVLISCGTEEWVCRTVDEVPPHLRSRLLESTNGVNSATILIADRRGRREIARALRRLPQNAQRRLRHSIMGAAAHSAPAWLTPGRRKAIMAVVAAACLGLIGVVFTYRW